jgi:hypothetical protein
MGPSTRSPNINSLIGPKVGPISSNEPGAARTRAVVTPNPQLFDRKQRRTAVQLIVLGSIRYQPELFKTVQRQIDKMALVTLRE